MARPLETLITRTLIGIRFWDPAADRQVSDDLSVVAWPDAVPDLRISAFRTASGIFAFQNLPGLYDYEHPAQDSDPIESSPLITKIFFIEVVDTLNNFMPMRFRVELPFLDGGLYQPTPYSSPIIEEPARFYLFSAPSRAPLPGLAVVRVTLTTPQNGAPAAYALIELEENTRRWYGLTDSRGCATIMFPYPTFITALGQSPPGLPPSEQRWPLVIRVRYDPNLLPSLGEGEIPTIRQIRNQPDSQIWAAENSGSASSALNFELKYGQELILRTGNNSNLWLNAASP